MSKPGDLVEFTAGLHGLDPPRNLGILLDRQRRKGVPWVRVLTLEGEKELKAEHLRSRLFKQRYDGDLKDKAKLDARLRQLVALAGGGGLQEESEDDLMRLEQTLWEATCDAGRDDWTEPEIAAAHYGPGPSPGQLRSVRECLDRCRRAGTGRFQTAGGRGDRWRPWTRAEADAMRRAWSDLQALRNKLVAVREIDGERMFQRVELHDTRLEPRDLATLQWVKPAMAQFLHWDGVPDGAEPVAGIGGLGAVQAFGMDLHRALGFLAQDWIRSEPTTTSSNYLHFLLETGLWTPADAVDGLVRRHVNQEEFFEHQEDPRAEADAAAFPDPAPEPGRTDLRHLACYTIDPPDARDFDDAVGLEPLPGGGHRLWVHVADVSHYVALDTYLDRHARRRATSVYLPGRVLPMLPHRISDHLCSLRDDGDRYALSVSIEVGADGRQGATAFHKALIRVTKNISYGQALEKARAGEEPFAAMLGLAERMRRHRNGLALETGELKVLLHDAGFSALEKHADDATRMIETFMVAANESVARHLEAAKAPLLFRCHPLPEPDRAERFRHQLGTMGIEADLTLPRKPGAAAQPVADSLLDRLKAGGGKLNLFGGGIEMKGGASEPADNAPPAPVKAPGFSDLAPPEREAWLRPFRAVVDLLADHPDRDLAEVATLKLLGCMGRAHYTPDNEGHFGLASTHYCHFTSPIRRYPDLVVHRNLKWLLAGRQDPAPHTQESLRALCDHCSDQERAADGLERRIKASCLVLASVQAESGARRARITGITPASLFVLCDDGIEARIPARDLPGGPYQADAWESMLVAPEREAAERMDPHELKRLLARVDPDSGEATLVRARLADRVTVRLAGRDAAAGRTGAQLLEWP
ncbi:MAG TPA: RNB domain-containing ribonuclease [Candidatus Thermoplasmatota archaeon]|nr:RNB domain-containing ribonuclease [Candidatus Thermoplasmatota archaeon]